MEGSELSAGKIRARNMMQGTNNTHLSYRLDSREKRGAQSHKKRKEHGGTRGGCVLSRNVTMMKTPVMSLTFFSSFPSLREAKLDWTLLE